MCDFLLRGIFRTDHVKDHVEKICLCFDYLQVCLQMTNLGSWVLYSDDQGKAESRLLVKKLILARFFLESQMVSILRFVESFSFGLWGLFLAGPLV
jgi:hypothetical protein